jgi:hypothetical protein
MNPAVALYFLRQWARFGPEARSDRERIKGEAAPPLAFVIAAVNLAVVGPTERDGELVAHLATERTRLG